MTKTPDQLQHDHVIRVTLENAAQRIELEQGNGTYMRAWIRAAMMIRAMKP